MKDEGPALQQMTRRVGECPADFLEEPRIGESGTIHVDALVADLLRDVGGAIRDAELLARFRTDKSAERNRLTATAVACWLLHEEWFLERPEHAPAIFRFLADDIPELAAVVKASSLVNDPDRREELVRLALKALGVRPAGESVAQAQDRLTTLSTIERRRVIAAARAAEERARAIREAMAEKAAQEAAARYMRE